MKPLYNIQNKEGYTIVFTRDTEAVIDALEKMTTNGIKHLSIVETVKGREIKSSAQDWLRIKKSSAPRNIQRYIKRLIKCAGDKEMKNDLVTLLSMSRRAY